MYTIHNAQCTTTRTNSLLFCGQVSTGEQAKVMELHSSQGVVDINGSSKCQPRVLKEERTPLSEAQLVTAEYRQ